MSVLSCPVCRGAMSEVNKAGVLIDTCTQCRGVWLDRGELEKLVGMVDQRDGPDNRPRQSQAWRNDDEDDDHLRHQGAPHKKTGVARLMDFFD
jgi:uncharacterized protein